uniref:Major facilitator superfamily (MFS) profile domain-containing protein n=1 Tax=Aureoumbra lagunensis TaxID=44058 RepID=A0A7S3K5S4_9STRA|mmetsp:Transcript_11534/g.15735  ORF Transcript_11534/g.15735 Transcript_11534/m.15735 type:complete len:562 (+) Transcript_11534:139-1824(+)
MVSVGFSPRMMMIVLILTNLVNYIDRGIIPGTSDHFYSFIGATTSGRSTSTYFGALQSGFIVGFSVGSVVVGHLVHTRSPFKLAALGLMIWCVSGFAAGISRYLKSYELLLIARIVSGVGEASFITVGGPYIQDEAGSAQGKWLGAFYAAIPCGTAIGYGYGAIIADAINWSWCFWILIFAMAPLIFALGLSKDDGSKAFNNTHIPHIESNDEESNDYQRNPITNEAKEEESIRNTNSLDIVSSEENTSSLKIQTNYKPGVWEEMYLCLRQPTFIFVSLGYAGYSGALIGFATFGPSILVGLGLWKSSSLASISFSGVLATSGIIGTPIGGLGLDIWTRTRIVSRQIAALEIAIATITIGLILVAFAANARTQIIFIIFLLFGTIPLFAATAAMNIAIFESVPHANRAFGQALAVMIMHGFGDVPTPIIVGILKDKYAPACAVSSHGHIKDDDDCDQQRSNLRLIGIGCACWLFFSILAFSISLVKARIPSWRINNKDESLIAPILSNFNHDQQHTPFISNTTNNKESDDDTLLDEPALLSPPSSSHNDEDFVRRRNPTAA